MNTDLASKLLVVARAGDAAQVQASLPPAGNPEERTACPMRRAA